MKSINLITRTRALLAGLAFGALGLVSAQASSTIINFSVDMSVQTTAGTFIPGTDTVSVHGSFNGWGALNLVQQGSGTVYTNTVNDTTDANGASVFYKYVNSHSGYPNGGYESLCDGGGNRAATLPAVSGSTLNLPTPFFSDSGPGVTLTSTITFQVDMSQQINLGYFTNGLSTVDVSGNFDGWNPANGPLTWDPTIVRATPGGLLTSNVYVGTFTSVPVSTNAHMAYQFVMNGQNYEGGLNSTNNDGGGNRFFTFLPVNQTNPVVFYADAPYAPVSQLRFSVDMSVVAVTDTNFNPASVTINGDLFGWGGVALTNNPSAANTNIYTSPTYTDGVGSSINYQFRYTELSTGNTVYDHANGANGGQGNRQYIVPNVANTNVYAVFNDASLDDYLLQPATVTFSVDMNGAVGNDGHVFDPNQDSVYLNGTFAGWYAWSGGVNPAPAPAGYQMIEEGFTTIYTNTLVIPAGQTLTAIYKYGIDAGSVNGGPADDEAASGQNHERVIRSTVMNPYVFATDTFGFQYNEPYFSLSNPAGGHLAVGAKNADGFLPVSWLGRPGANLQSTTNLLNPVWQNLPATDGTNWVLGYSSTNGFVSVFNTPAATPGTPKTFYRLIKK